MSADGGFSVSNFVGPALIATAITLLFNFWSEKRKAERDYVTKLFEGARDDSRKAVEAAMEYFPRDGADRSALLEAKVWMAERDIRHSLSSLSALCNSPETRESIERILDDFIDALTGGSFQNKKAKADVAQARKIASVGAELRVTLAKARQTDLQAEIARDPLSQLFTFVPTIPRRISVAWKGYCADFRDNLKNGDRCG